MVLDYSVLAWFYSYLCRLTYTGPDVGGVISLAGLAFESHILRCDSMNKSICGDLQRAEPSSVTCISQIS